MKTRYYVKSFEEIVGIISTTLLYPKLFTFIIHENNLDKIMQKLRGQFSWDYMAPILDENKKTPVFAFLGRNIEIVIQEKPDNFNELYDKLNTGE